ncbi:metallophosphoesterase [Anaerocolumna sp. MB42-C2]|uniref:metallophosphoesterase n=1 Tax=Anaerocolumna sp. MB42-C2 TaxID=3070997 RepID=UPI0027E08213|nr:metallophosphoesterase [Anaerocolumna sp. MB42-C2]WMJ88104.1 metallophosphoesterase [Anaerocolumna sp. MB42-C2]
MDRTLITVVILLIFILYIVYENHNLEITFYTIRSKRIPKAFHKVKLVVLADLHNNKYGRNNEKLLNQIRKIDPDYILVAGDMIVSSEPDNLSVPYQLLSELAKTYPVYYGLGNHEQRLLPNNTIHYKNYDSFKNDLQTQGVIFLENERVLVHRNGETVALTGLVIHMDYFKKLKQPKMNKGYIEKLVGIPEEKCYNILIAHNPVYFNFYTSWGADLILSGHLHGGIIRIPGLGGFISPQYKFMPKYDSGIYVKDGKTMLVSRGLGLHTIKLRIHNRPELMVVTLDNIED